MQTSAPWLKKKTAARWWSVLPGCAGFAGFPGWLGGGAQVGGEGRQAAERKLLNVSQLEQKDGLGKHETRLDWPTPWWEEQMWGKRREVSIYTRCTPVGRLPLITDIHQQVCYDTQSKIYRHPTDTTTLFTFSAWVFDFNYFYWGFIYFLASILLNVTL